MEIKKLAWDSQFFNKKIGEISMHKNEKATIDKSYDLIVVKQDTAEDLQLEGYHLSYTETKVIFEKTVDHKHQILGSDIQDTDINEKNIEFFKELAYESGKKSRFLLDENFGETKFKELYDEWIANSLNKKFALKVFFLEKENKAIGFVTVQKEELNGKIGLIAVHPDMQGQGIGKKLLQFAENYCFDLGLSRMEIPTQKENSNACIFYERQGHSIKNELIIKHFWRNDPI